MKWQRTFNSKSLPELFKKNLKEANVKNAKSFHKVKHLIIEDYHPSKRIAILSVITDKGNFTVRGDKIRWLFKQEGKILPSSAFSIQKKGSQWILNGSG